MVSTFEYNEDHKVRNHKLHQFSSEAEFRAYVRRIIIGETHLMECLTECRAAWEEARSASNSQLPARIERVRSQIADSQGFRVTLEWLQLQLHRLESDLQTEQEDLRCSVAADCLERFAGRHPPIRSVLKHDSEDDVTDLAAWLDEEDSIERPQSRLQHLLRVRHTQSTIEEMTRTLKAVEHWQGPEWSWDVDVELIHAPVDFVASPSHAAVLRTVLDYFPRVPVEEWSPRTLQERARVENAADRAALLLESGRLNELQTCFQLAHEPLGLPLMPPHILELISGYAARVPEERRVLRIVFSAAHRLYENPGMLIFESEAECCEHIRHAMIELPRLTEYLQARHAALPPVFAQLSSQLTDLQAALEHGSAGPLVISGHASPAPLPSSRQDLSSELGQSGRQELQELLAEWEVQFFNTFIEGRRRLSAILSPELVRAASLHPGGAALAHLMTAANPQSSLLELVLAFQHTTLGDKDIDFQFCFVYAAE